MADLAAPRTQILRFGPFELDVRAGELRKHGIRLRLREQPCQILLMLLEHHGEVVLRDEIRLRLWPNNTIVEFDHGINAAIQKLRDVLGESADKPRYIETVARRGYRFLGEVEVVGGLVTKPPLKAEAADAEVGDPGEFTGKTIAHYRILEKLGEGGMGVVYRAEDLKLGRRVALKFLPGTASELPAAALQRFDREARAIAALNHPHICQIYEVGPNYLAMELVEGRPLKGPIPRNEAVRLAGQIVDALDAAHRKGITHRDLKPANILVTKSGVKLLDFGLAKVGQAVRTDGETLTEGLTGAGTILGTLHYMSPEQIEGKEADARSDIFSFGLVLYEMITGNRAFDGDSAASVMAGILERETPALEPESLNRVVRTCLAKNPDDRFQSARDLQRALEWSDFGDRPAGHVPRTSGKWIPWATAAIFAALALLVWRRMGPASTAPQRVVFTIAPPTGLAPVGSFASTPEISPDGSSVLYVSSGGLWVRRLDSLEPRYLRGSRGYSGVAFWSADSRAVAFLARGDLIRIRVPEGPPEVIARSPSFARGGTWSDHNEILISSDDKLYALTASRHESRLVGVPGMKTGRYLYPQFLAGSEDFLFLLVPEDTEEGEVYLATLRDSKAVNPILLMKNDTAVSYTPAGGGRILFVRNDNLYSQKLDRKARKLEGDAELVQQGVASLPGGDVDRADFSVSRSGVVAWRPGKAALSQVTTFDRQGKEIGLVGPLIAANSVILSPDETQLVASGQRSWLLSPGQPGSLILGQGRWGPWSPDGSRLLGRTSPGRMGERFVNGSSGVHEFGDAKALPQDISPDGKQVLTMLLNDGIFTSRLEGTAQERTPKPIVHTGETAWGPGFSPDGRWIVYSVRGGANQNPGIYVQPFPGPGLRTQIANADGFPVWRRDGKEIVIAFWREVWSVHVDVAGSGLRFGARERLFPGLRRPAGNNLSSRPLAVSRDGSRFYFPQAVEQPDSGVIHVGMGWVSK